MPTNRTRHSDTRLPAAPGRKGVRVPQTLPGRPPTPVLASNVPNDSGVPGDFVDDALDQLALDISLLGSDDIENDSTVTGASVTDSLENLDNDKQEVFRDTKNIVFADSPYTVLVTDHILRVDSTGGAVVILLPAVGVNTGRQLFVKRLNSGANRVTITADAADLIDGAATLVLGFQYDAARLSSYTLTWDIL